MQELAYKLYKLSHLFWNLAEVINKSYGSILLERIINTIDINIALIEQMVEHID